MGFTKQAFSGFGWQTVLKILSNVVVVGKLAVLSRLLGPIDVGLFSLANIALGLTESITQTGVNITLLQTKEPLAKFINSAWVIAITRGFLIGGIMLLLGVGMQQFFDQPQLLLLVSLAALVPVIKGFINPAIVSLHKDLSFFADALYRFSILLIETTAIVVLVWWSPSVVSWVWGLVLGAVGEVLISFVFFKLKPRFKYSATEGGFILKNSRGLLVSSALGYLNENADNLLIGKLAGTYNLGLYQNSYGLTHEVNYEVTKSVHHSTLPVYTRILPNLARLQRAFFKTLSTTTIIILLTSLPLLFQSELVVRLIFGEKWLEIVPLFPWLIGAGVLHSIALLMYTFLIAQNKMKQVNLHQAVAFIALVGGIVWLTPLYGLTGAVMAVCLSRLVVLPLLALLVKRSL